MPPLLHPLLTFTFLFPTSEKANNKINWQKLDQSKSSTSPLHKHDLREGRVQKEVLGQIMQVPSTNKVRG
jgi:hypothetical protein